MKTVVDWLRAARQERRWRQKQARMYAGSDVLVVMHTKSGSTWLRGLLSHLFHLKHGVPADQLIRFDNLHALHPAIPKLHFVADTSFDAGGRTVRIGRRQRVVFLVRDPRDVAVSFFFHVRNRASARELGHKAIPDAARALPMFEFVTDPRCGIDRVSGFYNRWLAEAGGLPRCMFLRYEDLRRAPEAELRRLADFLGLGASEEEIGEAVRFAAFDSMRRKEEEGFFKSGRLGATDAADRDSYKVRRGEVGGYRSYFTPEQVDAIDRRLAGTLDPRFGYGTAQPALPQSGGGAPGAAPARAEASAAAS